MISSKTADGFLQDLGREKECLLPNSRQAQILDAFAGPRPGMALRSSGVTGSCPLKSMTDNMSCAMSWTGRVWEPDPMMMHSSSKSATPFGPRETSRSRGLSSFGISLMDRKSIVFFSYRILSITGKLRIPLTIIDEKTEKHLNSDGLNHHSHDCKLNTVIKAGFEER